MALCSGYVLKWIAVETCAHYIRIIIICMEDILSEFNLVVGWSIRQTAKFNSLPNFPVIQYNIS